MNRIETGEAFERDWAPWTAMLDQVDPSATRIPGVCGTWTLHDVVNHVQSYVRFYLAQVRGAFSGVAPTDWEAQGDRAAWPDDAENTLDARNEAIRVTGLSLTWEQLRDESEWLRTETLRWIGECTDAELAEQVGWVNFWEPRFEADPNNVMGLMVRRVRDMPAAGGPEPVWQFILPNKPPDRHMDEHLAQIRTWLAGGMPPYFPGRTGTFRGVHTPESAS